MIFSFPHKQLNHVLGIIIFSYFMLLLRNGILFFAETIFIFIVERLSTGLELTRIGENKLGKRTETI